MFDFDAGKLLIIGTVALVVIGPKDLPRVLRQVGQAVGKLRRMAGEFQGQFMDAIKEADLQDLRDEVAKLKDTATLDVDFDPAHDLKTHLTEAVNGPVAPNPVAAASVEAGSTSEIGDFHLPAPSEIAPTTSIASSGFGPAVDVAVLPSPGSLNAVEAPAPEPAPTARKKIVVTRRRAVASRLDEPGLRGAFPRRSRNMLPARRETPDP